VVNQALNIEQIARESARLLRATAPVASNPPAAEIARAAAQQLGVAAPSGARMSAFERQRSALPAAAPEGVIARLRKLFGKS